MTSVILRKILLASEQDWRSARRILFNPDDLKAIKICTGDPVALSSANDLSSGTAFAVGIAWPSEELATYAIAVSSPLLLTAQLQPGQQGNIVSLAGFGVDSKRKIRGLAPPREAVTIRLRETSTVGTPVSQKENQRDWLALLLRESLVSLKYVTSTQVVEVQYEGILRQFSISSASSSSSSSEDGRLSDDLASLAVISQPQVWQASWNTKIVLEDFLPVEKITTTPLEELQHKPANEAYATVGGLDKQISQIRDLLEIPLTRPDLFRHFGLKPPRGILLHGPPGTGKTHLARAIAASTNSSVLVINGPELSSAYHGETESKLRSVFEEAKTKSPCIVVLDEIDALVPKREEGGGGEVEKRVVATLLTLLDGMDEEKENAGHVVVIGTTNRPNAIDPALRRPGRFDKEFEIGIPNIEDRASILKVLLAKTPNNVSDVDLHTLASRAHGYVGADLSAVIREAGTIAIKRYISLPSSTSSLVLTFADLESSLPLIRPSAMRSLFVETPPIRYSEIGGQAHVIKRLKEAVEWPLLHPEAFSRLGIKPPKGVLLYGPPGCSKTVLARACATESGVNFVAVKGPELLSKYVGESERAVREIFRKARAASPSIILFDEIDALATSRTSDMPGSSEGVLTSLLNEMDGVQELVGVTVIAATNRPDAIDSALMRPGRLDRILYVGPPNQAGREEILRIRMKNMQVEANVDIARIAALADGCSGAEMSALCQEAALQTMQENMEASFIPESAFLSAAKGIARQITPTMLAQFERWRLASGHQSA